MKKYQSITIKKLLIGTTIVSSLLLVSKEDSWARDINYTGSESEIYITPGEPTQIQFPSKVLGGYKRNRSSLSLEKQDNYLVVFARPDISVDGEALIIHLDDKRTYALRVVPSSERAGRDEVVTIRDDREPEYDIETTGIPTDQPHSVAPTNSVAGLMREMVLAAEFGKQGRIPGFRRSNKYSGEVVLSDGTISATIDEMFLGPDLWGYVLSVENLLDTNMKINPASFRLDGTRAVSAEQWELAPRPLTEEQKIANKHKIKLYIVTAAKRS